MSRRRAFLLFIALLLSTPARAQEQQQQQPETPPAQATPAPAAQTREEQEPVKVFTEEVRLPVAAYDDYGHFDPSVSLDDILVLEDGEAQQLRSVRRLPANILFLLDTSAAVTLFKDIKTTRAVALRLLNNVHAGDSVSVMQFGDRTELLQDWTTDTERVEQVLKTKLSSSKRERLSEALVAAVEQLKSRPAGSRHVVLITDGVETPGGRIPRQEALKQLMSAQATVHVISYTAGVRAAIEQRNSTGRARGGNGQQRETLPIPDPGMPPGQTRNPSITIATIDLDRAMRRWYKKYADDTRQSEQQLTRIAEDTGGRILLATRTDEMIRQADEVSRDIGAQYVVTYRPKRPLSSSPGGEYRHVEVASRRVGLRLRARRGYVVTTATSDKQE